MSVLIIMYESFSNRYQLEDLFAKTENFFRKFFSEQNTWPAASKSNDFEKLRKKKLSLTIAPPTPPLVFFYNLLMYNVESM